MARVRVEGLALQLVRSRRLWMVTDKVLKMRYNSKYDATTWPVDKFRFWYPPADRARRMHSQEQKKWGVRYGWECRSVSACPSCSGLGWLAQAQGQAVIRRHQVASRGFDSAGERGGKPRLTVSEPQYGGAIAGDALLADQGRHGLVVQFALGHEFSELHVRQCVSDAH